ncbi:MAG: hypothetical protein ACP5NL_01985 [Thermoplasmata archaeon]
MIIDFYLTIYDTELINGDIKKAYNALKKIEKYARKNRGSKYSDGANKFAEINMKVLERKMDMSVARAELLSIAETYPDFYLYNKIEIEDPKVAAMAYIFRLEYSLNRYDPAYPAFNMQRCDDL